VVSLSVPPPGSAGRVGRVHPAAVPVRRSVLLTAVAVPVVLVVFVLVVVQMGVVVKLVEEYVHVFVC
jgi:hypothetical protein